ncbi:hypothetical protein EDD18DRAFT_1415605 [Armillaria luteobubalina]|uniref:Uncharacterized protein n=1 Tax=Armillaria luteobubalina TaxID=153913 RepID=A0AA39PWV5_9AGAR|nr:hypothetical protein EDD18DRAFT_1415605 [Armillaria luteobubalina]
MAAHSVTNALPPPGGGTNTVGSSRTREEEQVWQYGNTMPHSAVGGVGFRAGAAIGGAASISAFKIITAWYVSLLRMDANLGEDRSTCTIGSMCTSGRTDEIAVARGNIGDARLYCPSYTKYGSISGERQGPEIYVSYLIILAGLIPALPLTV